MGLGLLLAQTPAPVSLNLAFVQSMAAALRYGLLLLILRTRNNFTPSCATEGTTSGSLRDRKWRNALVYAGSERHMPRRRLGEKAAQIKQVDPKRGPDQEESHAGMVHDSKVRDKAKGMTHASKPNQTKPTAFQLAIGRWMWLVGLGPSSDTSEAERRAWLEGRSQEPSAYKISSPPRYILRRV